ncbi:MFS transporter [Amycolatopsis nigrescens]|uniref:MFS transporter n=1 Tax=Amycolatopsis nigrescens TaxID=381445 RepID=UPI000361E5E8|nr:MFS transporter [Amycolatopsis nigrescens]
MITTSLEGAADSTRPPLTGWLAVVAVMLGIFSIVTTEIMPIGLLTPIGASFQISAGTAGWMMTVPGIVAAVAAPLVTVATGRIDRRLMLCALTALLALADLLAAIAPDYWVMLVARVLVGLTIGGFWSIGAGLAVRLVRERAAGTATAVIFAAVPLGSVLGVPAGALIGQFAGWRAAFAVLGVLTVAVLIALVVLLPPLPAVQVTSPAVLRGLLRAGRVRLGLAATFLIVVAHFGAYTYVTPFLEQVTRVDPVLISTILLTYGVAGLAGNFVAGAAIARGLRATFVVGACLVAGATLLLPVAGQWQAGAIGLLVLWGFAYGAVPVCSQTWFADAAPHAREAATVLFTSSFQATISVGALLGGVVVDSISLPAVMVAGAVSAALTALTLWLFGAKPAG